MAGSTGPSAAFGQTLQFITSIKLQELEKQRLAYQEHATVLQRAAECKDLAEKVEILAKAIESWTGSGSVTEHTHLGGKLTLSNLRLWLPQTKQDPNFSPDILHSWVDTLETHIRHSLMRFDGAKLFGSLFNEWIASGDSSVSVSTTNGDDADNGDFEKVGRQEMHDQLAKLNSIIFDEAKIDTAALQSYLEDLFSEKEASKALEELKKEIKTFEYDLKRETFNGRKVAVIIRGLLASGLMDESKRATLAEFLDNSTVLEEVASVLTMRMSSLETWQWPAEGMSVEMRRHLNGKYRAFTDPEIIDAMLLQHIGVSWQVKLKAAFGCFLNGKAWKAPPRPANPGLLNEQIGGSRSESIAQRRQWQQQSFFLIQLSSSPYSISTYDDLLDAPEQENSVGPAAAKRTLLQTMATEALLNTTIHKSHAVVRSDLEWFGPSLPHQSILTVLKFFGVSDEWSLFFQRFLGAPLRFKGDPQVHTRMRGTPIAYALSVVCGEVILFVMDFAVNQKANGLFLYRMHDDLWLWDADAAKCAAGWKAMNTYAELVGLKFNASKTGSACVGTNELFGLPAGDIRWGFLRFDQMKARFVIDQKEVDLHIAEFRRQLVSTKSVFGWVNAYNKYMAFFLRNFGGRPAPCFGDEHITDIISTIARIQQELFPDIQGGAVAYLRSVIETRFGVKDLPQGYFYLPISTGGLELRHPMIELFALAQNSEEEKRAQSFESLVETDEERWKNAREAHQVKKSNKVSKRSELQDDPFITLEEYLSLRESWLKTWSDRYDSLMCIRTLSEVQKTPSVHSFIPEAQTKWGRLDWYQQWIVSLYGEEVVKRFGSCEVVDSTLIPLGMTSAPLRSSDRKKLKQRVISIFGISSEDGDLLVPDGIQSIKFMTHLEQPGVAYLAPDGDPLWFTLGKGSDDLIPTVYTLWKRGNLLPDVSTPAAVIPVLIGGADLMIPGVVHLAPDLKEQQLVSVRQYNHSRETPTVSPPLVVGRMALPGNQLGKGSQDKGKAVYVLHTWKDHLWEMGSKPDVPEPIPLGASAEKSTDEHSNEDDSDINSAPSQQLANLTIESPEASAPSVPAYTAQEISELLHTSLLQAIASAIPSSAFPIPATQFYTNYLLPSRPAFPALILSPSGPAPDDASSWPSASEITIKSSSHKSLTAFLKSEEKAGLITTKAPQKHSNQTDLFITSVNPKHPSIEGHRLFATLKDTDIAAAKKAKREEKAREDAAKSPELVIKELWKPHQVTATLFQRMGGDTSKEYTSAEVKTIINSYITSNSLVNPHDQAYINLDEPLAQCLSEKAKGKSKDNVEPNTSLEFIKRDELTRGIIKRMQNWYEISDGREVVRKKGELKPIQIVMKVRQGRKLCTLISGFEPFLVVNAEDMAEDLRKSCAGSTSVSPLPGKTAGSGMEVMVQGKQSQVVLEYLTAKGIPKKWIETQNLSGKK
ncbi:hypothetical protein H0H93_001669 [Arthromyces matolae]|nr:hypothetical protein H0H93_001669 [Arthromyces matolae]